MRAIQCAFVCLLATCALAARASAQETPPSGQIEEPGEAVGGDLETLELRITSLDASDRAIVDRGSRDGLAVGDRVRFLPRSGPAYRGIVRELEPRSALVEIIDPGAQPTPGTKGRARIPRARIESARAEQPAPLVPVPAPAEPKAAPGAPAQAEPAPELAPIDWTLVEDDWTADQPLLAGVDVERPADRPRELTGRVYSIADGIWTTDDDRSDAFLRTGVSLTLENPFGKGGRLNVDGELNYRNSDVPDGDGESVGYLRLDRLSYAWGGTRFENDRFEVGRFLHEGMPELGLLDGVEWSRRFENGHELGASFGYLPEPDEKLTTGHDLQVASWYRWIADELERVSASAGFQKTWHNGAPDRDLLIAKVEVLPLEGWDLHGTAWVDLYSSGDDAKDSAAGLTQVLASAGRTWDDASLRLSYTHQSFPDIERYEFEPVALEQIADDHNDRLAARGWHQIGERQRVHAEVGAWVDEDESGGDAELGLTFDELLAESSHNVVTVFATLGEFTTVFGARAGFTKTTHNGHWNAFYEYAAHRLEGFEDDNDDLPQHRVRGSRDFFWSSGWSFSTYAEAALFDDEAGVSAGFYLQKSF